MKFSLASALDRWFIKQPRLRKVVTKLLYGQQNVDVNILGNFIVVNTLEENGYYRFARLSQRYEFLRSEIRPILFMIALLEDNAIFIDIGANIGIWSVIMSSFREINRYVRVVAFEPDPKTFKRLKINAERYGFTAINCALGARCSLVRMRRGAVSHVTHFSHLGSVYTRGLTDEFQTICARLDCFDFTTNDDSLLMLKVDVEGAEMEVIEGAENTLRRARRSVLFMDGYTDGNVPARLKEIGFHIMDSDWFRHSQRILATKGLSMG